MRIVLLGSVAIAAVLWSGVSVAQAKARCVHHGESVIRHSSQLLVVFNNESRYLVCRRSTRKRRLLGTSGGYFRVSISSIGFVRLRGRFAYAVSSITSYSLGESAFFIRLDTRTWKRTMYSLQIGDDDDDYGQLSRVTALIPARNGRAVLRVANEFAAGIVLAGDEDAAYIDEGLATSVGRPQVTGNVTTWRHGPRTESSPVVLDDRCPPTPPATGSAIARVLATGDAVASGPWVCVRSTGAVSQLDGVVTRLLGALAVVGRPSDLRVVDLRSGATINGPAPAPKGGEHYQATVGRSGTLIFRGEAPDGATALIVESVGSPARTIATGTIRNVRYEEGLLRYFVQNREFPEGQQVTVAIP